MSYHRDFHQVLPHQFLRIEANFHFSSDFWKGQGVLLKIDNEIVWVDHHNWEGSDIYNNVYIEKQNIYFLEGDNNDKREVEKIWISPINIILRNNEKIFRVSFHVFGVEEDDLRKMIFWFENFNIYVK